MANAATVHKLHVSKKSGEDITRSYQSEEIVIAFSGAIGCGIKDVINSAKSVFGDAGYEVEHIRISDLIKKLYIANKEDPELLKIFDGDIEALAGYQRYDTFQSLGNFFRKKYNNGILTESVVSRVAVSRRSRKFESGGDGFSRKAFLVDQLKNPAEVDLLRLLYGNMFYVVGILSNRNDRIKNLRKDDITEEQAIKLINRDKKEDQKHKQQLEKTLKESDYFIRHKPDSKSDIKPHVDRLNSLIHGQKGITPTLEESGMFAAYSASLSSACMSRQVGAAICSPEGTVISTGCNDAPEGGGGLYTSDSEHDKRCYAYKGTCRNDEKKKAIYKKIKEILVSGGVGEDKSGELSSLIESQTSIGGLTEFSRAIHAEMDAIMKVARRDSTSTSGATLYSTTYPCHNCARHIVSAGFEKVVYIEPYEKSLALDLHDDSITIDENEYKACKADPVSESLKVLFVQFEGVSPNKYEAFFKYKNGMKKDGMISFTDISEAVQVEPVFTKAYHEIETKILENIHEILNPQ